METLTVYLQKKSSAIERALDCCLPPVDQNPAVIHEAMRYAVLGGGKRFRPILTLAVNEMLGGAEENAIPAACAVELIHSYSLVHDDLPVMDNDDVRRGKPSCHKKYGDAIALLVGDALLTLAFKLISDSKGPSEKNLRLVREIAKAAGTFGMVGGQVLDIQLSGQKLDRPKLDEINQRKTGELIKVSCLAGAIVAGAKTEEEQHILKFGEHLGFAFQVVDDIIDGNGCLRFMKEPEARQKAQLLIEKAKGELSKFGPASEKLCFIADSILKRKR